MKKILKDKHRKIEEIFGWVESVNNISDIRGGKPILRFNFNIEIPQNEDSILKDKIEDYIRFMFGDGEMDWRDNQELEFIKIR
tara:strand:+ start:2273 stop:2521 length:249 start_codon:yes stop_codon:yes gene_type:complete